MSGYTFSLGPVEYVSHRDGRPFTLVEVFRELRGVGQATIYRPDGTVVLSNAGALSVRSNVRRTFRRHPRREQ